MNAALNFAGEPEAPRLSRWATTRFRVERTTSAILTGAALRTFYRFFSPEQARRPPRSARRALSRRFFRLLERDLENVGSGHYPFSLLEAAPILSHRNVLVELVRDSASLVRRRRAGDYRDLPEWVDRSQFPDYYLRNFHWQSDGWLSERSARLYEASVEFLFGGAAQMMRRQAIVPLHRAAPRKVLDVGCATGAFLQQVRTALPKAELTGLDMSPFYINEARRHLEPDDRLALRVGNAEHLPFEDESFDAVTSVFTLHELPRAVRRTVVAEMVRVTRPGGVVVVCDSAQLSESSDIQFFLENFHRTYHEPFYREYLRDPIEVLFRSVGLSSVACEPHAVSKVVFGTKPGAPQSA